MRLTRRQKNFFCDCIRDLVYSPEAALMKTYIQHGNVSTFVHCVAVAYYSYWFCCFFHIKADAKSVIRGGFLHDFYLYDWHIHKTVGAPHGFSHPKTALHNAESSFSINAVERDIIEKHMWPLTVTRLPKYRESAIVCMLDKFCSLGETCHIPIAHGYDPKNNYVK